MSAFTAVLTAMLLLLVIAIGSERNNRMNVSSPASHFDYYGWFYFSYTAEEKDLAEIASYTNTAFAHSPEQAKILKPYGFKHIFYHPSERAIIDTFWQREGREAPHAGPHGRYFYEKEIPDFREKFFAAYRQYLQQLKEDLIAAEVYNDIDVFYIADEPALHRNVYLDQAFLERYVDEFKKIFPGKKCTMAFAENWDPENNPYPGTGRHFKPPKNMDLLIMEAYFYPPHSPKNTVTSDRDSIKTWIYERMPSSKLNWAKQFDKPIIVVGDARLQGNVPLKDCWITETYNILKEDPAVKGIVWFLYDKDYKEESEDGQITGAANDPRLVALIKGLSR